MAGNIRGHIAGLLQTSKRHTRYVGILALLAVVVAFGVTMGLRRNGRAATITETVLDCHAAAGVAHTHNADCYDGGDLVCPLQERELHVHDDSCYDEEGNLTCGKDEVTEQHVHGAGCFKTVAYTVEDPEPEAEAQPEAQTEVVTEETVDEGADTFKAGELTASKDGYDVTVSYGADAKVPDGAKLSVKALSENSAEYKAAREAVLAQKLAEDKNFDETTLGMVAVDISILDASGAKVEPSDSVKVDLKLTKLPKNVDKSVLNASLEVLHLDESTGDTVVETVAESDEVKVASNAAKATFTVDSFSTFPLTWNTGSATIHFGKLNGDAFEEFGSETVNFDTSASSFSVANTFEGYRYKGAVYCTEDQTFSEGVSVGPMLDKTASGGWQLTQRGTEGQGDTHITVANNSHIYATYYVPGQGAVPSGAGDSRIPSPTVDKEVTPNGDGTYQIQLDIQGATITEDNSHYANILIILDATKSMNGDKWTNAKAAMKTLIETLVEGKNASNAGKIDFALVTFGRSATVAQTWTKDNAAFKTTCANVNMVSTSGTNWEAGMRGGLYGVLNNMPDDDPTFVIFLTDGDPNTYYWQQSDIGTRYQNNGRWYTVGQADVGSPSIYSNDHMLPGYGGNSNTSAGRAADEARAIAQKPTYLYGIYCGDAGQNPSGESFERLQDIITGEGQDGVKAIAANANTIESEFKAIAETALESMGVTNASVDDGVPSLSSVSAQTVGEATGFEYYIATGENPSDGDFTPWTDAPGASYSKENGVTWDLSKVGTLPEKTTYRLKFTVWPSQEAYDLIADLNNGVKTMSDDELEAAHIVKGADGKYTLKTNSHLNSNYTFKGQPYSDSITWTEKEMDLPTEPIRVKKIWNNPTDWHIGDDSGNGVKLYLTKDGENYLDGDKAILVAPDGENDLEWESTKDVYISCGFIKQNTSTHAYEILESGHDYSIAEPESFAYYWDLHSDIYHPMVINGTAHYLIQNDDATGTDGTDYYVIKGADGKNHKYVLDDDSGSHVLTATNDRRSNLNLNKIINDQSTDQGADRDTLFEYTITVNNSNASKGSADDTHSDYYVWFSVYDPVAGGFVTNLDTNATAEAGSTGYYYAPSGSAITVSIKEGWGLRFLNLPKGTTYTITESVSGDWVFEGAEGSAIRYEKDSAGQAVQVEETYNPTVNTATATVSGSVAESNHSYSVAVTNKFEPQGNDLTVNKVWESGDFVTTHGTVRVALYKNGAIVPGTVKEITAPATSVTYDKITTLAGLEVREVVVSGSDVTPVDANGTIAVSGETTKLGSNATDTYVVTYSTGTATDSGRTDTVTNKMPTLVVNKQDMDNHQLAGATFKLTDEDGTALTGYATITSTDAESGNLLNGIYLSNGTYYLVETNAPDGFNKLAYKVKIVVDDGAATAIMTAATDPESTTSITDQTSENKLLYTFNVKNSNGTELPEAGGPGSALFNILGSAIATAAILTYGLLSRRTSEGRSWV